MGVAVLLILGGLTIAILGGTTPLYTASSLAESGSFFALASSGDFLYAASDNGGSILLEQSTDRGASWSASPVPYSAVAGGAPWTHAAVAVDGSHVILAAATGGGSGYLPYPQAPGVAMSSGPLGLCGTDSTILVASSPDRGITWKTTTFVTANLSVGSLQTGIEGNLATVGWLGGSTYCGASAGAVEVLTSRDAGQDWSSVQPVRSPGVAVPTAEGLEIAPENQGILIAFGVSAGNGSTSELSLWLFPLNGSGGITDLTQLPAPTSWTLQGDPSTPAYLLTPTYLIPLTTPPYTALPFNQLQQDGSGVGQLPSVVALVPTGPNTLEIAATTSNNLGVDCWTMDTSDYRVSQTCHVSLGSALLPSGSALPIVALIDGGGWWLAVGASGPSCTYDCYGPPTAGSSSGAPASVGTSVCITGCSSTAGLAAYSFSETTRAHEAEFEWVGALLAVVGVLWLIAAAWVQRGAVSYRWGPSESHHDPRSAEAPAWSARRSLKLNYVEALAIWALAWLPLALLAFSPSASQSPLLPYVIVLGAALGAVAGAPLHHRLRLRLREESALPPDWLFGGSQSPAGSGRSERVRLTCGLAYASWLVGGALLLLIGFGPAGGLDLNSSSGTGPALGFALPPPGALVLGVVILCVVGLRALYHVRLAASVSEGTTLYPATGADWMDRSSIRRTQLGAALLPFNPMTGLLLGWAFQSALPWSPFVLAWAFLPVTILGMALLGGCFGRSAWAGTPRAV
ncbi:MAG: hypothetical protein L3K19_01915 [Thermoplasmata archaeon]|nr:hypothetical protein [Thermoplasmata archaeon]